MFVPQARRTCFSKDRDLNQLYNPTTYKPKYHVWIPSSRYDEFHAEKARQRANIENKLSKMLSKVMVDEDETASPEVSAIKRKNTMFFSPKSSEFKSRNISKDKEDAVAEIILEKGNIAPRRGTICSQAVAKMKRAQQVMNAQSPVVAYEATTSPERNTRLSSRARPKKPNYFVPQTSPQVLK